MSTMPRSQEGRSPRESSSSESSERSDDTSSSNSGGKPGFLFGNVDNKLRSQAEYLDQDTKDNLGALRGERLGSDRETLSLKSMADATPAAGNADGGASSRDGLHVREHPVAVDYSGESEVIEEAPAQPALTTAQLLQRLQTAAAAAPGAAVADEEDDYDDIRPTPTVSANQSVTATSSTPAPAHPTAGGSLPALDNQLTAPPHTAVVTTTPLPALDQAVQSHQPMMSSGGAKAEAVTAGTTAGEDGSQQGTAQLPAVGNDDSGAILQFSRLFGVGVAAPQPVAQKVHRKRRRAAVHFSTIEARDETSDSGGEAAAFASGDVSGWVTDPDEATSSSGEDSSKSRTAKHHTDLSATMPESAATAAPGTDSQQHQQRHQSQKQQLQLVSDSQSDRQSVPSRLPPHQPAERDAQAALEQVHQPPRVLTSRAFAPGRSASSDLSDITEDLCAGVQLLEWEQGVLWQEPSAKQPQPEPDSDAQGRLLPADSHVLGTSVSASDPSDMAGNGRDDGYVASFIDSSTVLESFGDEGARVPQPTTLHAQMLRLDRLAPFTNSQPGGNPDGPAGSGGKSGGSDEDTGSPAKVAEQKKKTTVRSQPIMHPDTKRILQRQGGQVADLEWTSHIAWDDHNTASTLKPHLVLDMNDGGQIFCAVSRNADLSKWAHSRAAVVALPPKVKFHTGIPLGEGDAAIQMSRCNVSKDAYYAQQAKVRNEKAGAAVVVATRHANPAARLETLPSVVTWAVLLHKPRGMWAIPTGDIVGRTKASAGGGTLVRIQSLASVSCCTVVQNVDLSDTTPAMLWHVAKRFNRPGEGGSTMPRLFLAVKPKPVELQAQQPFTACKECTKGMPKVAVYAVFEKVEVLKTATAAALPQAGAPVQPPGAFQKRKDLVPDEGHVLLLEYFEEHPPLVARPGMGALLQTYYRKKSPTDAGFQELQSGGDRWRIGSVVALQPNDESPFLGNLKAGEPTLAVEAPMFRAPAVAYPPAATDYLVIRYPTGRLALREVQGTLAVGQQEPQLRVPVPNTKDKRDIEERRLCVHVWRALRVRAAAAERRGQETPAVVSVRELMEAFPDLSEPIIRTRLKDRCGCVPFKADEALWQLGPGFMLPPESRMRLDSTPDSWCALESMRAAVARFHAAGLLAVERSSIAAQDRINVAAQQLPAFPTDPNVKAAVQLVEHAMYAAPWQSTDAFVSAVHDRRGTLSFDGAGDPGGRGSGYSFTRDIRRHALEALGPKTNERSITGTDADLRRLSMEDSKRQLMAMGMSEEEVVKLTRWERINMVRVLSTAARDDGGASGARFGQQFARHERESVSQKQSRNQQRAQTIFDRQMACLSAVGADDEEGDDGGEGATDMVTAGRDGSDSDSMSDELKGLLEGSSEDEDVASPPAAKQKKKGSAAKKAAQVGDRLDAEIEAEEAADLDSMRREGFARAGEDTVAVVRKGRKVEAMPGERRLKRTIKWREPDGTPASRVVIITKREVIAALHSMLAAGRDIGSAWGFGTRMVKGSRMRKGGGKFSSRGTAVLGTLGGRGIARPKPFKRAPAKRAAPEVFDSESDGDDAGAGAPDTLPSPRNTKSGRAVKHTRQFTNSDGEAPGDDTADATSKGPSQGPAKRVRQEQTGVGWLNAILRRITSNLRRDTHPQASIHKLFDEPVSVEDVGDYNEYVPEAQQMALSLMERASRARRYRGRWDLRAHGAQIAANARRYNLNSPHGSPDVVGYADILLATLDAELLRLSDELDQAEAMFVREGGQLSDTQMPPRWRENTEAAVAAAARQAAALELQSSTPPLASQATTQVPAASAAAGADVANGEGRGAMLGTDGTVAQSNVPLSVVKDEWVQCSRCEKWRKVSAAALALINAAGDDAPWYCEQNVDDPTRASCDVPAEVS